MFISHGNMSIPITLYQRNGRVGAGKERADNPISNIGPDLFSKGQGFDSRFFVIPCLVAEFLVYIQNRCKMLNYHVFGF